MNVEQYFIDKPVGTVAAFVVDRVWFYEFIKVSNSTVRCRSLRGNEGQWSRTDCLTAFNPNLRLVDEFGSTIPLVDEIRNVAMELGLTNVIEYLDKRKAG